MGYVLAVSFKFLDLWAAGLTYRVETIMLESFLHLPALTIEANSLSKVRSFLQETPGVDFYSFLFSGGVVADVKGHGYWVFWSRVSLILKLVSDS